MWQHRPGASWDMRPLAGHVRGVTSVAWVQSTQRLYTASEDHSIKVWNPVTGTCTATLLQPPAPAGGARGALLPGHASSVIALAELGTPDGATYLLSGASDGSVCMWFLIPPAGVPGGPDAPAPVPGAMLPPGGPGGREAPELTSLTVLHLEHGTPVLLIGYSDGTIALRLLDKGIPAEPTVTFHHARHAGHLPGHVHALFPGPTDAFGPHFFSCGADGRFLVWQIVEHQTA